MGEVYRIYTRASREEVKAMIRSLPAILSGRAPDPNGLAHGLQMRLASAFLSKVKEAFVVKSHGGTDEAGIKWAPLTKAYLAYGRRFGKGEQAALKRAAGLGPGNQHGIGNNKGLLTKAQQKRWQQIFAKNFAWLAACEPPEVARASAARIAWSTLKREGAKTKLEVFGNRTVAVLHDTGVLFNSLSPGELLERGTTAELAKPSGDGGDQQILRTVPGELIVGTNVAYAGANHKRRPLWPEPDQIPASWWEYFETTTATGLARALVLLFRN